MATVDQQIVAAIGAAVPLYAERLAQDTVLPAVTYSILSSAPEAHMAGYSKLRSVRVQFDVWAYSAAETKQQASNLLAALIDTSGRLETEITGLSDDTGVYRRTIEYYFQLYED